MYEHKMFEAESAKAGRWSEHTGNTEASVFFLHDLHASSFLGRVQAGDSRGVHKITRRFPFVKNHFCIIVNSRLSSVEWETLKICQ